MKIDFSNPKVCASPLVKGFMWQSAAMKTLYEANMKKYFPHMYKAMKAFEQGMEQ